MPSMFDNRIVSCQCELAPNPNHILSAGEPNSHYNNSMWLRKGQPKRCECGHWFKMVDADPNTLV